MEIGKHNGTQHVHYLPGFEVFCIRFSQLVDLFVDIVHNLLPFVVRNRSPSYKSNVCAVMCVQGVCAGFRGFVCRASMDRGTVI